MSANSEDSGETARMHRLAWAFAGHQCDKCPNLVCWLNWQSKLVWWQQHYFAHTVRKPLQYQPGNPSSLFMHLSSLSAWRNFGFLAIPIERTDSDPGWSASSLGTRHFVCFVVPRSSCFSSSILKKTSGPKGNDRSPESNVPRSNLI